MTENEKKDFLASFGRKVREGREYLGYSQEHLADLAGYTSATRRGTISKIETGESDPPASKILAIARALDTDVTVLIDPDVKHYRQVKRLLAYAERLYEPYIAVPDPEHKGVILVPGNTDFSEEGQALKRVNEQ